MKLKIVNKSNNALPNYETANSAGLDLRAFLPEGQITIKPLQRVLVPTGLFMEIPTCEQAEIEPVEILTETERGSGGFGHTGAK